ncbi:DUF3667 domain-containing protein [bacterium]|nr:DUF3667 domain-containing protein [bacterium]NUM78404.1 DUF3667 domain-containing protein [candidate division KSB1 bacterium]RIK70424.1 MAG: hypothetical protein DCC62_22770 [candidate division KSB1 bacterium]
MTTDATAIAEREASRCVSCGATLRGKYCHACGEKAFNPHEHSVKHFLKEFIHTLTHIDSKFFKSLVSLFCKPGVLTRDYIAGKKKSFTRPITLFIIGNVLYFFVQPLANINSFNSTLRHQIAPRMLHGPWAQRLVADKIKTTDFSSAAFQEFEQRYNAKSEQLAKTLIIVQIPLFALLLGLSHFYLKRFYFDHLIFATHFFAFLIYLNILATLGVFVYLKLGSNNLNFEVAFFIICIIYLMFALHNAYRQKPVVTLLQSVLATAGFVVSLFVYRIILFLMTYATVS